VIADDPEPDDLCVRVSWLGRDDDGKHLRTFNGPMQPISEYQEAIDWAVSMADMMEHRLYVLPFNANELMKSRHLREATARLSPEASEGLRQSLITLLGELMRDSEDPEARSAAYNLLRTMKVFAA
jgi:hypothetical protein